MNNSYKVIVCSDVNYEELIAEIYIDDNFIALLSQEEGDTKTKIEFFSNGVEKLSVDLNIFEEALNYAKQRLGDMRKLPAND